MDQTRQFIILGIGLVVLIALMFWPQLQARRRRQQQLDQLRIGDEVVTVGGIIGTLAEVNRDENRAAIEVAPGVRIQVLLAAIGQSHPRAKDEAAEQSEPPEA